MIELVQTGELPDVAFQVTDHVNGFAVRHVENGTNGFLEWQVGVLENEWRSYRAPGMPDGFAGNVTRLIGYGYTQEEALTMAQKKGKRYASV